MWYNKQTLLSSKNNSTNKHTSYNPHPSKKNKKHIYDSKSEDVISNPEKRINLTLKLSSLNQEHSRLYRQNTNLKNINTSLLKNIHEMNPGFTSNTSNTFPMLSEIQTQINNYIKITCQDIFFDLLLEQKLAMNDIIYFYQFSLTEIDNEIRKYFNPLENEITTLIGNHSMPNPIYNVLKKVYQSNYKNILNKIENEKINYINYANKLKDDLALDGDEVTDIIVSFLKTTTSLCLMCYLCEPQIEIGKDEIGNENEFNALIHDPLDGFVKPKQITYVLLPGFFKGEINTNVNDKFKSKEYKENMIVKMQVLSEDYAFGY